MTFNNSRISKTRRKMLVTLLVGLSLPLALGADAAGPTGEAQPKGKNTTAKGRILPNADKLTNSIRTIPYEQVVKEATDSHGLHPKSRVTTPLTPVVVRQDAPDGPKYQEALGYTFLINEVQFPGLARMEDGLMVLTLKMNDSGFAKEAKRVGILLFSSDDGQTWSQPRRIPVSRTKPIALGGKKLLLGNMLSDDAGQTWTKMKPLPTHAPDGKHMRADNSINSWVRMPDDHIICASDLAYTPLVEGGVVTFVRWATHEGEGRELDSGKLFTRGVLWRFHPDTETWDEPYYFPKSWGLNEGSLVRAKNGDLVAAFRTQMIGVPMPSDHWMGLATTRSTDEGKTWSEPAHHFLYGVHHCNLITLPDGRILMTYVARIGELEGRTSHGVEAVISHDHGVTWDWPHRYIVFRWPYPCSHSPQSVRLSDGRIFTIFMHNAHYSWTDSDRHPFKDKLQRVFNGHVSAVIWSVDEPAP